MNPRLDRVSQNENKLTLSFTNTNYSIINALRRTIISDIPVVSFTTFPHEDNKCEIFKNTSGLNNEIIKHRLACIPVHLDPTSKTYETLKVVLKKKNDTDQIMFATTGDFQIYDTNTDKPLSTADRNEIFPPNEITKYFIDFVRLNPEISKEIPGEEIHLEAMLDINTAVKNGCYNCVSTCSYINTPDIIRANDIWITKEKELKALKTPKEKIESLKKDWFLLDANRIYIENSFEFTIETIGIYSNENIFKMACTVLLNQLEELKDNITSGSVIINQPVSTTENEYEVILENIDFTIGKVIEYYMYEIYYNQRSVLTLCGFYKKHPHENYSILRLALTEPSDKSIVNEYLITCIEEAKKIFATFNSKF